MKEPAPVYGKANEVEKLKTELEYLREKYDLIKKVNELLEQQKGGKPKK